jgi:nucleotide-binding universal stress UspA family protein
VTTEALQDDRGVARKPFRRDTTYGLSAPMLRGFPEGTTRRRQEHAGMEPRIPTPSGVHHDEGARTVVVGVDGSSGAEAALRYAIDEARRQGASLRVVGAWSVPPVAYMGVPLPVDFAEDCERAARTSIERSLEAVGLPADVPLEVVIAQGQPAGVLVAQARSADLLVVGSRGLGGFRELLLGSVSQACVHHAHCPVTVVPDPARRATEHEASASAEVTA